MPYVVTGMIFSSLVVGLSEVPSKTGRLKPYMSASSKPTFLPRRLSDTARLAAMVDLPTPPLPLAIAINCVLLSGDRMLFLPSIIFSIFDVGR
ncbi:Uncharacterised protein [Listeria booriae]|nr:Uncharacterised protein [Listeria booriae]